MRHPVSFVGFSYGFFCCSLIKNVTNGTISLMHNNCSQSKNMRTLFPSIVLIAIFGFNLSAEMLIDTGRLNGSFESGETSPWTVDTGDSMLAVENGIFAYDGIWYAEVGIDAGRAHVMQYISSITPTDSDTFTLSFQARKGTPGPGAVTAGISSTKTGGAPVSAKLIGSVVPELSDTEWKQYSYTLQFEDLWDPSSDLNIRIGFRDGWTSGSKGFLDNIVLEQIPEPYTVLVIFFGLILIVFFKKNGWRTKCHEL